jgi:hypothetical protein
MKSTKLSQSMEIYSAHRKISKTVTRPWVPLSNYSIKRHEDKPLLLCKRKFSETSVLF